MANPNNSLGTNAAFGGRTTPNAFNDVLGAFQGRGILSGWTVAPDSGMSIVLGGDGEIRDVALAEDNAGNKTTVNNISGQPVELTLGSAPSTNSRIDAIVAYIANPPQGSSEIIDNYTAVNLLAVQGDSASSPVAPDDSAIRTAITADGASGATAYYVILGYITIASGTTDITADMITQGSVVQIREDVGGIPDGAVTSSKIANEAVTSSKIDWTTIPTYSTTIELAGFWWNLRRQGNLVIAGMNDVHVLSYSHNNENIADAFPVGYRPNKGISIVAHSIDGAGTVTNLNMFGVYSEDTNPNYLTILKHYDSSGATRMALNACWFTDDDFPNDE